VVVCKVTIHRLFESTLNWLTSTSSALTDETKFIVLSLIMDLLNPGSFILVINQLDAKKFVLQ